MLELVSPWSPITDKLDLKVLGKLGEELGECTSATARCIIQGINESEPVTKKPNQLWLEEEIADVLATTDIAISHFKLDATFILNRAQEKKKRLLTWHKMPT